MSHFFINVFLTAEEYATGDIETIVQDKLAPYNENMQVHEQGVEECYNCGGSGDVDVDNSLCETCNGSGTVDVTYNPDSKWDWWVIGGRWDGVMASKPPIGGGIGGFNFGEKFHTPHRNACTLQEFKVDYKDRLGFAQVTPDGSWHERGQIGWFGTASGEKKETEWKDEVKSLLFSLPDDCMVVGVDAHI